MHSTAIPSTDADAVRALFQRDGALARVLEGFEERKEQTALAEGVRLALTQSEAGFFEAGTGTGKSLAYLLPAAMYALAHEKRVVVSTHTISLQEQLVQKDLPLVHKLLPQLRSSLVKGWSNYVCRLRLEARRFSDPELFEDGDDEALERLVAWAEETEDGTRSDLPFEPSHALWGSVCAESDSCLRSNCPYYHRCHFFRDRAAMSEAHILVVNHHLLFADVAIRRELGWETDHAVLPHYDAAILDEAHHVEDVATAYLGATLSQLGAEQLFGRLYRRRQGRSRGVLPRLAQVETGTPDSKGVVSQEAEWAGLLTEAERALQAFFEATMRALSTPGPGGRDKRRLSSALLPKWEVDIVPLALEAGKRVSALSALLAHETKRLGTPEEPALLSLKGEADAARRRLSNLARTLEHFAIADIEESVTWLEQVGRRRTHRLVRAPIDVGPAILDWVSHQVEALVLVSATLSVAGTFEYQRSRLGLEGSVEVAQKLGVREALFDSPFDFRRQALLAVADNLPDPSDPHFVDALAHAVERLVIASRGRALVLFTSFRTLESVRRTIAPTMAAQGLTLLAQGEAPRTRLLERFKTARGAVLLGTDSFWEGIDVPGEALSLVILTRLPFDVPTEPIGLARSERMQAAGRSPFYEYALPRAVLKLKQGFGRLIRTTSDRGAVVICDPRVKSRSYGRTFLNALPPCRREDGDSEYLASVLSDFL